MTVETTQKLADVKEDAEELETVLISNIRSMWKRINEPESIEPLAMVDKKGKGQPTSFEKTKKKKGSDAPKKRKLTSHEKAKVCFVLLFYSFNHSYEVPSLFG